MSSQSKLRFEPQGWVARPDCFYVLPIAAKYLGAKDPSQLQQSLCQRSIALGASLTRPGCASSQCRHRPEPFVRRGMWLLLLPSLFFFLDGPSDSTGSSGRIREVKCSTFFSSGRWVQRDAVLTRPGRLRGEKLKCPFSNEINKPTQALSAQHSFPGVPSGHLQNPLSTGHKALEQSPAQPRLLLRAFQHLPSPQVQWFSFCLRGAKYRIST